MRGARSRLSRLALAGLLLAGLGGLSEAALAQVESLVVSPNPVTVEEGASANFTVKLATAPSGDVTVSVTSGDTAVSVGAGASLTFTTSNYATAQMVTLSASEDKDGDDDSVRVSLTASGGGYDRVTSSVIARVNDNDIKRLILPSDPVTVEEGASATFSVALATAPSSDVTVSVTSSDMVVSVSAGASLTFTTSNYATPQMVTLSAAEDKDGDDHSVRVSLSVSGGGYDRLSSSVIARVNDNDMKRLILPSDPVTVEEGASATFSVALATAPSGDVTVSVTSSDPVVSVSAGASLTFTTSNYATPQMVTLSAAEDKDGDDHSVRVSLSVSGGGYDRLSSSVIARVNDNDFKRLILPSDPVHVVEGASATFTVALATAPSGDVTVSLTSSDPVVSVSAGASLTFTTTNYATPQTVTLSADEDEDGDGHSVRVHLAVSGGGYDRLSSSVIARVFDNDMKRLILPTSPVHVVEGASATFTVALATAPSGDVTVSLTSSDPVVSVSAGASLTFTTSNYATPQTVTLSAAEDGDGDDHSVRVHLTVSGGGYDRLSSSVIARVFDNDFKRLILPSDPVHVDEGASATFTVALATAPSGDVTVSLTSGDPVVSVSAGASLTFTTTNYATPQTVTLSADEDGDGDGHSVRVHLAVSGGGYDRLSSSVIARVFDNDFKRLILPSRPVHVVEGASAPFRIALATAPSGDVTVSVTSSDAIVSVSAGTSLTFTTSNYATPQTVIVSAAEDEDSDDHSVRAHLAVSGGGYDRLSSSVIVRVFDNDTREAPEPGPSAAAQRRVLKHVLAAIAQTTVDGAADMIGRRFDAAPGSRALTLAGRPVGSPQGAPETAADPRTGSMPKPGIAGSGARDEIGVLRRGVDPSHGVDREVLLRGSAFTLSLAGEDAGAGGPDWTVWGRGDWRAFEGHRSGERWDGKQWTGWLGVDSRVNERLMAGVAVSQGESEADYRLDEFEGGLETSLTVLWPYLQMKTAGGGAVRVVLGAGTGEAEHRASAGTVEKADLSLLAGSMSGRLPVARRSGYTLSAIGGVSLAQIETDGPSSTSIGGLTATSWRLNAGMEAEHDGFALASGSDWQVRPRGALALRRDGGDGVTGTGMEVSAGMRLSAPGSRFGFDASGHWLALHSEDDTRERGVSVEARLAPGADGRGLSLALGPAWGQQVVGALAHKRLFDQERDDDAPERLSLTARAGYGFAAAGGLLTPFADMALSGDSGSQHYRTGIGFAKGGIDAALTAGHRAGGEPDTRIGLDLRLHY